MNLENLNLVELDQNQLMEVEGGGWFTKVLGLLGTGALFLAFPPAGLLAMGALVVWGDEL